MGITRQQALDCFASDDLIGIGMEADAVRRRLHPEGVVSYALDGRIALGEMAGTSATHGEELSSERIFVGIRDILDGGGTGVHVHVDLGEIPAVDRVAKTLGAIKQRFPKLRVSGFNASEILAMATQSQTSTEKALSLLHEAGLEALGGEDAELLDDAWRQKRASTKCSAEQWIGVHRVAHRVGLVSTATMRLGEGETPDQRVTHLELLRDLQDETGGFNSFSLQLFKPSLHTSTAKGLDEATSVELLKTLAVSRMLLDNIYNIGSSWSTQGLKVLQMGLRFGSNDAGSLEPDDVPAAVAGNGKRTSEEELRRLIRDAGFKPVQRDALFRTMFLH